MDHNEEICYEASGLIGKVNMPEQVNILCEGSITEMKRIAAVLNDTDDLKSLKAGADSALYIVKKNGRDGFIWYKKE